MVRLLSFLIATLFVNPAYFGGLHWRMIGPFRGGRALAVTGVPGSRTTSISARSTAAFGRASTPGAPGIRSSTTRIGSIGAIAVAPSNPRVIYVGSGEADMRSDIAYGNGMYKSTDGGKTWTHIGLEDTRQIGAIVVDPRNANVAYVAALGHAYGPNAERGVFKTTDGGANVEQSPLQRCEHRRDLARDGSRRIRTCSTRRCGKRAGRRGTSIRPRTARAADSTRRPTAARPGRN